MTETAAIPNFFVVGPPKAGTTAFVRYLEQHPHVFISPIKEPGFFAPEVVEVDAAVRVRYRDDYDAMRKYLEQPVLEPRERGFVLEWDQYLKLFKGVRREIAIGEATVAYIGSPGAPAAIRARIPNARIMMILRDPADRLQSHWASARAAGISTHSFARWIDEQVEVERSRVPPIGAVWSGFYGTHLQRFLKSFPAGQIKAILYDDYVRDPKAILREVFGFLGVAPDFEPDVSRRHNVTLVPRWKAIHDPTAPLRTVLRSTLPGPIARRMRDWWKRPFRPVVSRDERAKAIAIYHDDVLLLKELLQWDLSSWLDVSPPSR